MFPIFVTTPRHTNVVRRQHEKTEACSNQCMRVLGHRRRLRHDPMAASASRPSSFLRLPSSCSDSSCTFHCEGFTISYTATDDRESVGGGITRDAVYERALMQEVNEAVHFGKICNMRDYYKQVLPLVTVLPLATELPLVTVLRLVNRKSKPVARFMER